MIYGVSFNTQEKNSAFAQKYNFNFPLLCDTDRKLGVAYGAADNEKSANARRVGVIIGPDGKIVEYIPKASAQNFPSEALKML